MVCRLTPIGSSGILSAASDLRGGKLERVNSGSGPRAASFVVKAGLVQPVTAFPVSLPFPAFLVSNLALCNLEHFCNDAPGSFRSNENQEVNEVAGSDRATHASEGSVLSRELDAIDHVTPRLVS